MFDVFRVTCLKPNEYKLMSRAFSWLFTPFDLLGVTETLHMQVIPRDCRELYTPDARHTSSLPC